MTPLRDNIIPASLITLSAIGITFALYSMKTILVPFVFSIFLYFIIAPFIRWLINKCHFPRILALLFTFIFLSGIFTGFILILGITVKSIIDNGKLYYNNLFLLVETISEFQIFQRFNLTLDFTIIEQFLRSLPILDWISYLSGSVVSIISNIVLVLIFLLFIAIGEKSKTARRIIDDEVESKITRYIATKFFTSFLTGTITFIILFIFKVEVALLLASITFFLNFIPNIGSIFAVLAVLPILFLQFGVSFSFFLIMGLLIATQFIIGNIVDPKLLGENLGLHPVMILLSLLFWGYIWGVSGMFLAVPMSAVLKILINRSEITEIFLKAFEKEI
ncbi:MAG: AI-2E family transporter [Candidatus Margulisiibacteriota bacterium]|nr:AI-2E family transporter [Candidatus Margulisiibacteriota bacterium]